MRNLHYFVLLMLLCATLHSSAQQFLNGSMEPQGTTITPCNDIAKAVYNSNMGNVWEAGEVQTIYFANNGCGLGNAAAGNSFTVMKYRVPLGNLLNFKLSGDLVPNQSYGLVLQYKTIAGATNLGGFRMGYAKDSASFDSVAGYRMGLVNTNWQKDTLLFTPKKAWHFMWVEVITLQGMPFDLHIDDLKLITIGGMGVKDGEVDALKIFPNPSRGIVQLSLSKELQLPCKLQLTDITGKKIMEKMISDSESTIDNSQLAHGIYLLSVTDREGAVVKQKLMIQ